MDLFFTFSFLFLTLFAIKIYLIHQKTKEGFQFHRRKHNQSTTSPTKTSIKSKKKQTEDEQLTGEQSTEEEKEDVVVENMDITDPLTKIDEVINDFQDLRGVYERNVDGYPGGLGSVDGIIPEIRNVRKLKIKIPFPLNIITQPVEKIVNFFVDIINAFIDFFNLVLDMIDMVIHYTTCAFTLLVNFFTVPCVFWYILNLIIVIIYLPFSFIFWLLGITDIIEEYIWGPIYIADDLLHDFSGFHFAHFPDSIMKGCYSCPAEFEVLGMSSLSWIGDMFKSAFQYFPKN